MNLQPKTLIHQTSQMFLLQSTVDRDNQIRVKLTRLVYRHEEMKSAYQSLKSHIKTGLLQAEEVFASLAIPLIQLVGLKTAEMAEEGRFSTIVVDADSPPVKDYYTKATIVGRELIVKQQSQLIQLISLLRQIETQVNSRENDMLQTLAKYRISLNEFFQKSIYGLSKLHHQNRDTFFITVKLLQALFEYMGSVIGSVQTGVDDLMRDLAEHMCNPMVEYVKCLRADMKMGACARLLAIVDEMDIMIRNGRLELEEARKRVRVSEEEKIEALYKLKETEATFRRMNEHPGFFPENKNGKGESCVHRKFQGIMEDYQDKDDTLLWELLKKKRKYQTPESPMGPGELNFASKTKCRNPTRQPLITYSPGAQSCLHSGLVGPQTPRKDTRIPLGSSPSVAIQQAVSRRQISP